MQVHSSDRKTAATFCRDAAEWVSLILIARCLWLVRRYRKQRETGIARPRWRATRNLPRLLPPARNVIGMNMGVDHVADLHPCLLRDSNVRLNVFHRVRSRRHTKPPQPAGYAEFDAGSSVHLIKSVSADWALTNRLFPCSHRQTMGEPILDAVFQARRAKPVRAQ